MYEACVIGTIVLMFISATDYVRRAWIRETNPVPATWILMMVVMGLSFWMYWSSPNKSWTGNIAVVAGCVNIAIILVGVIATNIRYGTLHIAFDKVQKWCLLSGGVVVLFWFITDQPLISYILVQCIALIAYVATVKRLWQAKESTEPLIMWIAVFFATLCAVYPAWVKSDLFSWIYLARALPSTLFVVLLIAKIKYKMRSNEKQTATKPRRSD